MEYHIIHKINKSIHDLTIHEKLIQLIQQLQKEGFILLRYDSVYDVCECDNKLDTNTDFDLFIGFNEEERENLIKTLEKNSKNTTVMQNSYGITMEIIGRTYYFLSDWKDNSHELLHDMRSKKSPSSDSMLSSLVVKLCGIKKNKLEEEIEELLNKDSFVTISTDVMEVRRVPNVCEGSLKDEQFGEVLDVKIYLNKILKDKKENELWEYSIKEELKKKFGASIYTFSEQESLESLLIGIMNEKGLTLTAAESCTGGLFMANMINVSGASNVINQSFVTYANEAKEQCIGVTRETLSSYGAVSKQTAGEMARGAAKAANASISISITGIAGPLGGTPEKPVGTVYLSCYYKENTHTILLSGIGSRDEIRNQTVQMAKTLLLRVLLEDEF